MPPVPLKRGGALLAPVTAGWSRLDRQQLAGKNAGAPLAGRLWQENLPMMAAPAHDARTIGSYRKRATSCLSS